MQNGWMSLALCLSTTWAGMYSGQIVLPDHTPVADAWVVSGIDSTRTNAEGKFMLLVRDGTSALQPQKFSSTQSGLKLGQGIAAGLTVDGRWVHNQAQNVGTPVWTQQVQAQVPNSALAEPTQFKIYKAGHRVDSISTGLTGGDLGRLTLFPWGIPEGWPAFADRTSGLAGADLTSTANWLITCWQSGEEGGAKTDPETGRSVFYLLNKNANACKWRRAITGLLPNAHYRIIAKTRGVGIKTLEQGIRGGVIGGESSRGKRYSPKGAQTSGTWDWRSDTAVFMTDDKGAADAILALGTEYNTATGEIRFDSVQIQGPLNRIRAGSAQLDIEPQTWAGRNLDSLLKFAWRVHSLRAEYVDLTGPDADLPDSAWLTVALEREFSGGLTAGNPILWGHENYRTYLRDYVEPYGDVTFAMIHEIGHIYADNAWGFAGEMVANLKAALVMDQLRDGICFQEGHGGHWYGGSANPKYRLLSPDTAGPVQWNGYGGSPESNPPVHIDNLFKAGYRVAQATQVWSWDAIQWKFQQIAADPWIGREAFKATFRELRANPPQTTDREQLFLNFMAVLQKHSKRSWQTSEFFTPQELTWMKANYQ